MQNSISLVAGLLLLIGARTFAEGRQKEIKVEPESLKVTITSGTTAEATLFLTNTAKDSLVLELEAGELLLTASDQIAVMRFLENGEEKERLRLTLFAKTPRHKREIKLKMSKVKAVGTFEGALVMRNLTRSTEEMIKVQVKKTRPPVFDLELAGAEIKEGRIELQSTSDDTIFTFLLKNPATGIYRDLKLVFIPDSPFQASITPDQFTFEPGNEQMVTLRLSEMPGGKVSMGMLTIIDEMEPGSRKTFFMGLRSSYRSPEQIALFVLLVFAGSIFSLILGTAIPRTIVKLKNRRLAQELGTEIREHAESGSPISVKLAVLRNKLGYLNDGIKWYGVTVTERIEEINRLKAELEADLKLVVVVKHLRNRVEQTALIPRNLEAKVENLLVLAERNLLEGDRENAKVKIDEARKIFDEKEALAQLQAELTEAIAKLPENSSGVDWMEELSKELKASRPDSLPPERLGEVQRRYAIVDLYLNKFKNDILKRFPDFQTHEDALLELLRRGLASEAALQEAGNLIGAMNLKLFENDIIDDIRQGKGSIEASTFTPLPEQIIAFRFVLHDRHKDESFLARRLRYEWNFGDMTNVDIGKERVHYFRTKPQSWWSPLKKLWRGRSAALPDYEVALQIKNRAGKEITEAPFKQNIFIRSYHDKKYRVDISSVEFITFFTVFFVALGFAINMHFDEMKHFHSFKDLVTPFLWGFGLDQGKNTFMESFKSISQGAGKVE
ncbi:MAG: hypothetical protein ACREOI_31060 [bacterium]